MNSLVQFDLPLKKKKPRFVTSFGMNFPFETAYENNQQVISQFLEWRWKIFNGRGILKLAKRNENIQKPKVIQNIPSVNYQYCKYSSRKKKVGNFFAFLIIILLILFFVRVIYESTKTLFNLILFLYSLFTNHLFEFFHLGMFFSLIFQWFSFSNLFFHYFIFV